jgi:aspartyl protease family protein
LWVLLFGLGVGLLILVTREDEGMVAGLLPRDFATIVFNSTLAVFVGGMVLALFRQRWSQALEAALLWVVVALLLALGYAYRFELREVSDHVLAELIPGHAAVRGNTVELSRARGGDFSVRAQINGARIPMVLDTGASAVVLTHEAAKAAGLPLEVLNYSVSIDTANGRSRAAAVTLDRLAIGNIVERSVPALITPPGQLRTSLLGMSFLNRLESWQVHGDRLLMQGYP